MPPPTPASVDGREVRQLIASFQQAASEGRTKTVAVDERRVSVPYPFPSPADWRDCPIYFLMLDRFNNPAAPPRGRWNSRYDHRQGGSFNGVREQLGYIRDLGARAIWLTPPVKNPKPFGVPGWDYNYHGYGAQDFLAPDERFASDGTRATAERELADLVDEAHARGLYVIFDIVLNHAGRVFDYLIGGQPIDYLRDPLALAAPFGQELPIRWLDGTGAARAGWDVPPAWPSGLSAELGPDDAVWPADLQRADFFRRRGDKVTDEPPLDGYVAGDFGTLRQLVAEYEVRDPADPLRQRYGRLPVLNILVRSYQYLIARYDVDAFRIDTAKYVSPRVAEMFGNAIREFALSAGKANFFTFGEIVGGNDLIARYVGRNSSEVYSFGIDAALDFPLFDMLRPVVKAWDGGDVAKLTALYEERKRSERELLSSHGEAGRFFVTFLDNHDQPERFLHPDTPVDQLTLALGLLFSLLGIPCVYCGTEQALRGTSHDDGTANLGSPESVREALWGKSAAFNQSHPVCAAIRDLAALRAREPALRYGRQYFRELSGNGRDFGPAFGVGGVVAFSRILVDRELLTIANTNPTERWAGSVLVDPDLNPVGRNFEVAFSNRGGNAMATVAKEPDALFYRDNFAFPGPATSVRVELRPMEVQVLIPT